MKRVHVLEFEDLAWFPDWLRRPMTNLLVVLGRLIGVVGALELLVSRVLREHKLNQVVDLGSGGGGTMPDVIARVREHPETKDASLLMTDLYPNRDALARHNHEGRAHIRYHEASVDATDLEHAPPGLRTMINCFHHMRPEKARAILESAARSGQPFLVYEMADNKIPFAVWALTLPLSLPFVALSSLLLTPLVRPLRLSQLFFTYVVPLVPLFYAWDGQASMPRIYTLDDLDELLRGLETAGYRWEKGYAKKPDGKELGIYLLGEPAVVAES